MVHTSKNVKRALTALAILAIVVLVGVFMRRRGYEMFADSASVTFYFMDGCPHCVDFEPEWELFVKAAKAAGIATEKIESKDSRARDAGIKGFPTIMIKKTGAAKAEVYSGDRTSAAIMAFVKA